MMILYPGVDFLESATTTGVREKRLGYECGIGNIGFFYGCSGGGYAGGIVGRGSGC